MAILPVFKKFGNMSIQFRTEFAVRKDVSPGEWDAILDPFRDANVYQTREYECVRWGLKRVENLALFNGTGPAAATQVRVIQVPNVKAGVAYVYRGPIWRPKAGQENLDALREAIRALHGEFVVRRRLLLRLVLDLAADELPAIEPLLHDLSFSKRAATPYRTFILDLEPSIDALYTQLSHTWRANLRKAEGRPFEVAAGTSDDLYCEFLRVYDEMVARKQFDQRVNVGEFRLLQRKLPESRKMNILVCRFEGAAVAAGVCARVGDTALQVFLATSRKALEIQAAYKLLWEQVRLSKQSGARSYDTGGVDRAANPGGYQFKHGLSGREVEFAGEYEACDSPLSRFVVYGGEYIRDVLRRQSAKLRMIASRRGERAR